MSDLLQIKTGKNPEGTLYAAEEVYKHITTTYAEANLPELNDQFSLFERIPPRSHRKSYVIPSHQKQRPLPAPGEKKRRKEEWICISMYWQSPDRGYSFGKLVGYQIPLKTPGGTENDGLGKIDLLAQNGDTATLLELKQANSREHPLRAFLEAYTYWKQLGGEKAEHFLKNSDAVHASILDKAVVFYRGSQIADKLIHSSEAMTQFLRKLQVKCYFVDQSPQSEYLFDHVTEYKL